jgi:2-dehydro-3-deoxyphosphogluconate aldolase / (4S)-4-hydroxy-2-oxoglutarate aldolase
MSAATDEKALKETRLKRMLDCGVIAVIRATSRRTACDVAKACADGGIVGIEITLPTPDALSAINDLAGSLGDSVIMGAGTVMDARAAKEAIDAGAKFIVAPYYDPQTLMLALRAHAITIPGAFTPTEIVTVTRAGADVVKVFPSTSVGPTYFTDIRRPLPWLKLMATGGVTTRNLPDWLRAGSVAIGAGADMLQPEKIARGDWAAVTARCREYLALVKRVREEMAAAAA